LAVTKWKFPVSFRNSRERKMRVRKGKGERERKKAEERERRRKKDIKKKHTNQTKVNKLFF
jgi:hypothetical protein